MKVTVVLRFKDRCGDPTKAWIIGSSAWKSDFGKRISRDDLLKMAEHAIDHTTAMMDTGDDLTITIESSGK